MSWWKDGYLAGLLLVALGIGLAFMALGVYKPWHQRIAGVDPVGYYAYARSLLFDGDLQFANEYRALNAKATFTEGFLMNPDGARTATGHLPNLFSIGPGILWTPIIGIAHGVALMTGAESDGFSRPYHTAVFLANAFYGLAGLVCTYLLLRTWFLPAHSTLGAFAAWACSPALYYTYGQIAMAHACSFFCIALFLLLWARLREREALWPWALIGAALGLAALVRWQNAAFGIVPAIDLLWNRRIRGVAPLALCAGASILFFVPQMIAWKILYGSFFTIPQGEAFVDWGRPDVINTLFSMASGLITWTPLCAVAIAGLFVWRREYRPVWIALAAAFAVQLYVNSVVPDAGWSFGMRRMVNCTPLFAVGIAQLAALMPWRLRWNVAVVLALAFWNFLFVLQYCGFIDRFYVERAAREKAAGLNVPVQELVQMTQLPNGESFDLRQFASEHRFPRGKELTARQLTVDKLVVLRFLIERAASPSVNAPE
ncbi:MAG: hypothetical protein KJ060_06975 [Candidatus Hydrogenedentes bacterium]|nr:hypothetical protein [Candidatus Hydrogenedentota bacterium]